MTKNFSLEREDVLNNQIKEFIDRYNTPYDYELIKRIEDYLNLRLVNSDVINLQQVKKGNDIVSEINITQIEGFGHDIEKHVYNVLSAARFYLKIDKGFKDQNPNGAMQFPDYEFGNGIWADSKGVICKPLIRKDNYSKNYNSGLGDRDEVRKDVKDFVYTNKLNQKTSSLIILSYYTQDEDEIKWLKVKIVPYLFYISCYQDEHDFAIKQCTNGDVKNANVQGRLNIKEGSCEVYLDKLRRTIKNIETR